MAFANNQLTAVTIPNSVSWIGPWAFQDNQIISITIGNDVTFLDFPPGDGTGGFGFDFAMFYYAQERRAGTYTYIGNTWAFQPR